MHISLRLFAILRDAAGQEFLTLDVAEGASVHDAFAATPLGTKWSESVAFARDDTLIPGTTTLNEGDMIDCLPPVSGG